MNDNLLLAKRWTQCTNFFHSFFQSCWLGVQGYLGLVAGRPSSKFDISVETGVFCYRRRCSELMKFKPVKKHFYFYDSRFSLRYDVTIHRPNLCIAPERSAVIFWLSGLEIYLHCREPALPWVSDPVKSLPEGKPLIQHSTDFSYKQIRVLIL